MLRELASYLRALWKHWIALASGVGALVLSALSAYFRAQLPYRSFWLMSLIGFFVASFRAWRDVKTALESAQSEVGRLGVPKYTAEQHRRVRELYERQDENTKALLREVRIRGFMTESQASTFYYLRGASGSGMLHALEFHTSLVYKSPGEQYRVNPKYQAALDKVLEEHGQM